MVGDCKPVVSLVQAIFAHKSITMLSRRAFDGADEGDGEKLVGEIYALADELRRPLRQFVRSNHLDLIIVQNALKIPMNLPLGVCLTGLIAELGIDTIAHHHDFYWERERYRTDVFMDLLDTSFPCQLPNIQHVTISTIARKRLKTRWGIDSTFIPNVRDFSTPPPEPDGYSANLRQALGLKRREMGHRPPSPTCDVPPPGVREALRQFDSLARTSAP